MTKYLPPRKAVCFDVVTSSKQRCFKRHMPTEFLYSPLVITTVLYSVESYLRTK